MSWCGLRAGAGQVTSCLAALYAAGGAAAWDGDSKGTCLPAWAQEPPTPAWAGGVAWMELLGLPASQLPPTAVPLRGNPAGGPGSIQLWFKQLIF